MKKALALLLAALLLISLMGCGVKTTDAGNSPASAATEAPAVTEAPAATEAPAETAAPAPTPTPEPTPEPEPTEAPEPAQETVAITIPADLVGEGESGANMLEDLSEDAEGIISVTENEDGSITYVMTREAQQDLLKEMAESIEESVWELTEGEDADPAIKKIAYTKDFSEFTLVIDQENASGFEIFYALALGMVGANYQACAGNGMVDVPVKMQDAETGEIYSSATFTELMEMFSDLFSGDDWETDAEPLIPTPEVETAVLLDGEGIVVTLNGISTDFFGTKLNVRIENGSESSVMVDCDRLLVNDYYAGSSLYATVEAGETAEEELYLPVTDLYNAGVEHIGKIDVSIAVFDTESYERIVTGDLVEIRTSDYAEDWDKEPAGQVLYDDNGLVILYLEPQLQESFIEHYYTYNFCFVNRTDADINVECESFILNGEEVSTWIYKTVPAGKRAVDYATFFQSDLEEYGIEQLETVEMVFSVRDEDSYDVLFDTGIIAIDLD